MGWIITRLGNSYIFNESNAERSVTFESLSISLVEGKIKLEEFGKDIMTLTFSQIDTIGNLVATDIENAYDLIIRLGQPPYSVFFFRITQGGQFRTTQNNNFRITENG